MQEILVGMLSKVLGKNILKFLLYFVTQQEPKIFVWFSMPLFAFYSENQLCVICATLHSKRHRINWLVCINTM